MASRKVAQLIIFAVVAIDLLGFAIVLPLLPRYADYYQADEMTLGLLMSSFSAMQFLFAPIWGRLSDKIGRRPVILIGLFGSTFFYGIFGWISTLPADALLAGLSPLTWLFLSRIGAGVSGATLSTAQAFISDSTTESERGKGMALIGAAFGIGFTFGPLIGAPFVSSDINASPSHWPGVIASIISGTAFLVALFKLPESLRADSKPAGSHWMHLSHMKQAIAKPSVGTVLLTIFVATFAFAQFEMTLPYMTKLMGMSDRHNFYIFAYIGALLTVFQGGIIRRMIPRVGEIRMGILGAISLAIGLAMIGWVASIKGAFTLLMAVLPVSVFGFAAVTPSLQALLSLGSSDSDQGGILGIGQSVSALSRILGPVAGYAMLHFGYNMMPYYSGAVIMLIVAVLISQVNINLPSRVPSPDQNEDVPGDTNQSTEVKDQSDESASQ